MQEDEELVAWQVEDKLEKVEKKVYKLELSWDLECSKKAQFMKEPEDDAHNKVQKATFTVEDAKEDLQAKIRG